MQIYAPQGAQMAAPMTYGQVNPGFLVTFQQTTQAIIDQHSQHLSIQPHEMDMLIRYLGARGDAAALEFQTKYIGQSNRYDPNTLSNFIVAFIQQGMDEVRRALTQRGGMQNTAIAPSGNMMGSGNPLMDYHNIGKSTLSTAPAPAPIENPDVARARQGQRAGMIVGRGTVFQADTPIIPEPPKQEIVEVTKGAFAMHIEKITICEPRPAEIERQELLTIPTVQECKALHQFASSTGTMFDFMHMKLLVPYSSGDNALSDLVMAYSDIRDPEVPYAHLIEFNQMFPTVINYDVMVKYYSQIKSLCVNDPFALITGILDTIPDVMFKKMLKQDLVRNFNDMAYLFFSIAVKDKVPFTYTIETLEDIQSFRNLNDPSVAAFISELNKFANTDMYMNSLKAVVKALGNIYFFTKDPDRTPYLNVETDEMVFAATMETSGIRVDKCVGRNFDALKDENSEVLASIVKKLKMRTISLKKHYMLVTNIDLPEATRLTTPNSICSIPEANSPLHHILGHVLSTNGIFPLSLDLRETNTPINNIKAGISLNGHLVFKS